MKKMFNRMLILNILYSLLFIIFGVFLLVKPKTTTEVMGYILGIGIFASGIGATIKYFTNKDGITLFNFELIFGILSSFLGVYIFVNPLALSSFLVLVLGLWITISGAIKTQYALEIRKYKQDYWWITLVVALMMLFVGLILVFNPFSSTMVIAEIIGIFIIIYGVLDILELVLLKQNVKSIMKALKK